MTSTACVTGCVQRGKHLTDCPGTCRGCRRSVERPHTKRCDEKAVAAAKDSHLVPVGAELDVFRPPCTGCLPRQAEQGRVCAWCAQRFSSDVATAPSLVRHLREVAHPTASAAPIGDGFSTGDPAEASILSAAITGADDLHALLATFAQEWLDAHPGSTGPDARWARKTHQTIRTNEHGKWIRRPDVAGIHVTGATDALVKWLLPHLDWFLEQVWIGEARSELASMTANLHTRWPIEDSGERAIVGIPCPRCEHKALTYTPPSWEQAPFKVACNNPECGRTFAEDEWERLVALTTGHKPSSSPADSVRYVRPVPALRAAPAPGGVDFQGLSAADDDDATICPTCHLAMPCEHAEGVLA